MDSTRQTKVTLAQVIEKFKISEDEGNTSTFVVCRLVLYIDVQILSQLRLPCNLIHQFPVKWNAQGAEKEAGVSVRCC